MSRVSSQVVLGLSLLAVLGASCRNRPNPVQSDRPVPPVTTPAQPSTRILSSFENESIWRKVNVFDGVSIVREHATHGTAALCLSEGHVEVLDREDDWRGYDYLAADIFVSGRIPVDFTVEIRDKETTGYWTRVNYSTVLRPGREVLKIPLDQLFVGEKSRPGRPLDTSAVTRLVFGLGDARDGIVYIDRVRLERDTEILKRTFEGLHAFDFGKANSPLMPGFKRIDAGSVYREEAGYGLEDPKIWRSYDVLQPDPLYQDFICLEGGGLAVDLPDGVYEVFVNMDNPSGYWGERQAYDQRTLRAEGEVVVSQGMTFDSFKKAYFRFSDIEDLPTDDTFDKYQKRYYEEQRFEVTVADGQLNLSFEGENWACSVSAVVIYPKSKQQQGRAFLEYVEKKRRFFFDNYFRRVLHAPEGDAVPDQTASGRGYVLFSRDYMSDVYYNDRPRKGEVDAAVQGAGFAGEAEPLTVSVYPLKDLGAVRVSMTDLAGPGLIPRDRVEVGYVSYRLSRVTPEGTVYTISPRLVVPRDTVSVVKGITRRFWMTLRVPEDTLPGDYAGEVTLSPERAPPVRLPVRFRVFRGTLDEADLPVGPWGHTIDLPWLDGDPEKQAWDRRMARKSLEKLRQSGFTTFSGMPVVRYLGFEDGVPTLDFARADEQMAAARAAGFTMPIVSYTQMEGLNLYHQDKEAMARAGFRQYHEFVKALFSAVERHARDHRWLPVYWNIGDEPLGDDLRSAIENARAYKRAFPVGPPFFTAATSTYEGDPESGHFELAKQLHVANLSTHDEPTVRRLKAAGVGWAFYNAGSRWTYGIYMFKARQQLGMAFRLSWHWNNAAGDPYYALDCREDDYAWANATPAGDLVMSVEFEREMREGLDDYRYLLTLWRLAQKAGDAEALSLIQNRLGAFKLGETSATPDWRAFRREVAGQIERLRSATEPR